MANAAGGTSQRLKPGFATIRSRLRSPAIGLSWFSFQRLVCDAAASTYRPLISGARSIMRHPGRLAMLLFLPLALRLDAQSSSASPDWLGGETGAQTGKLDPHGPAR